jgi:hypothetical protein
MIKDRKDNLFLQAFAKKSLLCAHNYLTVNDRCTDKS